MAQIDPQGIRYSTECFAIVKDGGYGFIAGRLLNWRLHDLNYPLVQRTVSNDSEGIEVAFETREELEAYMVERMGLVE